MTSPLTAANAYASLAKISSVATGGAAGAAGAGQSFGTMLKDAMGAVMEAGHKSDAQTTAMASGKANIVDVVTAVSESETAVSALVSVRDRVIQSYEEIMRMPI